MTRPIHPTAAQGFGDAAGAYQRGRPDYPTAALELVADLVRSGPPGTLVDLAAGTGIFTTGLARQGLTPVAVEPLPAMRTRLATRLPGLGVVAATAEALPFRDRSVGAITVAQAFHWFDGRTALDEAARVTAAGSLLVVVFNVREAADPLQAALDAIWEPYRAGTPTHRSGAWRAAFQAHPAFPPLEHAAVPHTQVVDADALVDRVLSVSFVAVLPEAEQAAIASRTRGLVGEATEASLRYRTDVWWTRRQPRSATSA